MKIKIQTATYRTFVMCKHSSHFACVVESGCFPGDLSRQCEKGGFEGV